MLSKNRLKLITSLAYKKNRDELGLFTAEGSKSVVELLPAFKCRFLLATQEWLNEHNSFGLPAETIVVTPDELKKSSSLKTAQGVLAVFEKPAFEWSFPLIQNKLSLALDNIQDPGNLGTIIRTADWFGIEHVFCTETTADVFGSKAVQATMGALSRVKVHYVDLHRFLSELPVSTPVYGTSLDGENIYETDITSQGVIVMGNEGNGISEQIELLVSRKILIPSYPVGRKTSESLNVGIATAIVCAEFCRRDSFVK